MKANEDGFYSVADCVEALEKAPIIPPALNRSRRAVDLRRKDANELFKVMRKGTIEMCSHWHTAPGQNQSRRSRLYASHAVHLTLDGCEDFDQLITVLQTLNKMNQQ